MPPTSLSLLARLRGGAAAADWDRLVAVYTPFIRRWLSDPALAADSDDLLQEVLATLVRELPKFRRQRAGSFRAWLRTITVNFVTTWHRRCRGRPVGGTDHAAGLRELADPHSTLSARWDREHDAHVMERLMTHIRPTFTVNTWEAFTRQVVDGEPASEVAKAMSKSVNAVLLAKSRVLARLRAEADGLI